MHTKILHINIIRVMIYHLFVDIWHLFVDESMYRWTLVKIVCYRLGTRVQIYDTIGLFTDKYKVYILSLYFCILNFLFQIRILNEPSGLSRFLHILLKTWALSEGSFHFITFRRNILCYWCLHIHLKKNTYFR